MAVEPGGPAAAADCGRASGGPEMQGESGTLHPSWDLTTRDIARSVDLGLLSCLTALAAMISLNLVAFRHRVLMTGSR